MARLIPALFCLLFFFEGLVFIPYIGLQSDEMLFGNALYPPKATEHAIVVAGREIPTMLMSYVGALKAWIYAPLFRVWPPSAWSVRIPALAAGALTVWLFYCLARNWCGRRAALVATALLATDAMFVLTTCLDWGPVALQHLLLVSGLLLVWHFHRSGRRRFLAAAFFAFGLAMWDKALFSWVLVGLCAAALVVFPRDLFSRLTWRNALVAAVCFLLGAAPLVVYNYDSGLKTFRGNNTRFTADRLDHKALVLRLSFDGSALFGYMIRDRPELKPIEPRDVWERTPVEINRITGERRAGLLRFACIAALAMLPWLWRTPARKPMLFALVFAAVTWIQMALTRNAGGTVHHTVLLWPFPQLFVGAAFAEVSRRFRGSGRSALAAVLLLVCAANLAVLNQYLAQSIRFGTTTIWTDAIGPLAAYMRSLPASRVYTLDWGILEPLRALGRGRLPLSNGRDALAREDSVHRRNWILREMVEFPDAVFIDHTAESRLGPDGRARLESIAQSAGYRAEVLHTVAARGGQPVFDVFRFVRRETE